MGTAAREGFRRRRGKTADRLKKLRTKLAQLGKESQLLEERLITVKHEVHRFEKKVARKNRTAKVVTGPGDEVVRDDRPSPRS